MAPNINNSSKATANVKVYVTSHPIRAPRKNRSHGTVLSGHGGQDGPHTNISPFIQSTPGDPLDLNAIQSRFNNILGANITDATRPPDPVSQQTQYVQTSPETHDFGGQVGNLTPLQLARARRAAGLL